MELRGNRGEWSELYALLKLLADGRLYCGDASQNRQDDRFFPILKIFRNDQIDRTAYTVNAAKKRNPCVENQRLHHRRFPRRNANKGTFHFKCHKNAYRHI